MPQRPACQHVWFLVCSFTIACNKPSPGHAPDTFVSVCVWLMQVAHRVFEVVDSSHRYNDLRSTRHFGSMAFYYAWYKKIDYLLIDMINRDLWVALILNCSFLVLRSVKQIEWTNESMKMMCGAWKVPHQTLHVHSARLTSYWHHQQKIVSLIFCTFGRITGILYMLLQ